MSSEPPGAISFPHYPRSAAYPAEWMLRAYMGPNVLWLSEALAETMALRAGQRVLDLGCGKALSSIFLAREYGVQVWAAVFERSISCRKLRRCLSTGSTRSEQ